MVARTALVALAALTVGAQAHSLFNHPSVWGLKASLENPLNQGTKNWFCGGQKPHTGKGKLQIRAGQTISVPVTCGEAVGNADNAVEICSNDIAGFHNGGGCSLAITSKQNPTIDDFTIFSVAGKCPDRGRKVPFQVPANLPAGEYVCSWSWIPDPSAAAAEYYENCFDCTVVSDVKGTITGGIKLRDHVFGVPGFPSNNQERRIYKNAFKSGAQKIEVSGGGAPAPAPTSTRKPSSTSAPTSTRKPSNTSTKKESTKASTKAEPTPTAEPTKEPVPTAEPTAEPTEEPVPTEEPTEEPVPTAEPTAEPTAPPKKCHKNKY